MHERTPLPHRLLLAALTLGLVAALAGCSSLAPAASDASAAGNVALAAVDDAFAGQASGDGSDLAPAALSSGSVTAQAVDAVIVVRRVDMQRRRRLVGVHVDRGADPVTASVAVWVSMTGRARILKTYPVSGAPVTLLGVKPIAMQGTVTVDLVRAAQGWRLSGVSSRGIDQGAYAAAVQDMRFDPDPLLIGRNDGLAHATLVPPAPADDFLVVARGRYLGPHGVLADDGVPPDAAAGDRIYSGTVWVGARARPGAHLAFVTALDYTRTVDVSRAGGAFDQPYTDTLQPVLVQIAAE